MAKYPTSVFLLLLAVAVAVLGGCAGPLLTKPPPVDEQRLAQADRLRADGVYHVAAEIYLSLADETTEPLKSDLRLSAIESLLASGDTQQARELLESLPANLGVAQQNRVRLANAEAALVEYQPDLTLELLASPLNSPVTEASVRYRQLRAEAYRLLGDHIAAIQERIRIDNLIPPGEERRNNQFALWQDLLQTSEANLSRVSASYPSEALNGWISLVQLVRGGQQNPEALAEALSDWEVRNPSHPAVAGGIVRDLQAGIARLANYPQQVGVLLPFTGPWSRAAAAVRDGMLAAYYARPDFNGRPTLRFYDTGINPSQTLAKYQQAVNDGAGFLIGPLRKESVNALGQLPTLGVPILTLNAAEGSSAPINLYHFSLAPEDEASQVAEYARSQGYQRALAIVPSGPWGERIVSSFASRWESLGGELLEVQYFSDDQKQLSNSVSELLNINDSKRRHRNMSRKLGKKLEFEPRRRQDADFVLVVALPQRARLIRPLLQFHRASDLPALSTSHVYNGYSDSGSDRDMNGILFCDMPWVLSDSPHIRDMRKPLDQAMPDRSRRYTRFYAMGIDAYNLVPYLPEMGRGTFQWYNGMTGNLRLDEDRNIRRTLLWAQFHNGVPQLLATDRTQAWLPTGELFPSQDEREPEIRMEAINEDSGTPHRDGAIR